MKTLKNINKWVMVIAFMSGSAFMASCSESDPNPKPVISLAGSSPVYYNTQERWLQVQAIGDWKLSVVHDSEGETWCSVDPSSGSGNRNVVMKLTENEGDAPRTASIQITAQGSTSTLVVEQLDPSQGDAQNPPPPINPGATSPTKVDQLTSIPNWMELPATVKPYMGKSAVVTHDVKIGSTNVRNFTMLYDTIQKVAYWVAYPIAKNYFGAQNRTDKWEYDPKVPFAYQPNLTKGYPLKEGAKNKYDRGHQMPSADRTANYETNAQTFYFTNMTAQQWQFNQNIWKNLEDDVRDWAGAVDTLYVVTGAILGSPVLYTKDISGADIAVPKYYYKALLGLKLPNTYKAIGFWFENRIYDNNSINSSYAKSIEQLQTLTGFTFFPNLPDNIETTVKAQYRPQDWAGLTIK